MKELERECPNCGSSIKIEEGKNIYKCEYCGTTLERDKTEVFQEMIQEHSFGFINSVFKSMMVMRVVSVAIFVIAFLIILFVMISMFSRF